ncbi:MAG: hypothetical protein M1481_03355 [Candidatus Thermoplasmatota archaeon]|nr:hypothetical protein [Candidatus Thermoplasmatota archaeon]MCL5963785.1 hypothetical protein [Candidatus Thermoplasmatota archaeon]
MARFFTFNVWNKSYKENIENFYTNRIHWFDKIKGNYKDYMENVYD